MLAQAPSKLSPIALISWVFYLEEEPSYSFILNGVDSADSMPEAVKGTESNYAIF